MLYMLQLVIGKISDVASIQQELAAILEAETQLNTQFDSYIQQGDVLLSSNNVDESIIMYEQAMALKPGDEIAYSRIKEANHWKTEITNYMEDENKKSTQYDFLVQKGDILVSSNKFDEAIALLDKLMAKGLPPEMMNVASRQMASSWVLFRVMVISPSLSVMCETVYLFMGNNAGE